MAIVRIEAAHYALPLKKPTRISTRNVSTRSFVVVKVVDDEGQVGWGYTYVGTVGGADVASFIENALAPTVIGSRRSDPVGLWGLLYQEVLLVGRRGLAIRALSALDIALWDLLGRRLGVALATLLGGDATARIPAYASGGYYIAGSAHPADAVRAEIESNRAAGFSDHKIKVGGLSVEEDAQRVAAAISAIDGSGRLALDANNAYRDVPEANRALRLFRKAADGEIWWFEEPLSPDNVHGHAELAHRNPDVPIATGEIHQTRWDFAQLLSTGAAAYLQLDAGVAGGITEYLRIAAAAEAADIRVAPHWHANVHAQLAAASTNHVAVEHFLLEKDIYNFERIVTPETRLGFQDGFVTLPDAPGIGVEFDQRALDEFRTG